MLGELRGRAPFDPLRLQRSTEKVRGTLTKG
jgi:hypothetical protein